MKNINNFKIHYLIEQRLSSYHSKYRDINDTESLTTAYKLWCENRSNNIYINDFLKFFKSKSKYKCFEIDGACCFLGVTSSKACFQRFIPSEIEDFYCRKNNISPFFVYDIFEINIEDFLNNDYEITDYFNYDCSKTFNEIYYR